MTVEGWSIQTGNLPPEEHKKLTKELDELLPNAELHQTLTFSFDPPKWIEFAASAEAWKAVFGVGAAAFIAGYGKKSGELLATATPDAIRKLYAVLRQSAKRLKANLSIRLKTVGPAYFVNVSLPLDDEARFYRDFSHYVKKMEAILRSCNAIPDKSISADVFVYFDDASYQIEWISRPSGESAVRRFDFDGNIIEE